MKRAAAGCLLAALLVGVPWTLRAQDDAARPLAAVRGAIERAISAELPGWQRKAITPMEGSSNVVIDQWESGGLTVKVSILQHPSSEEAAKALKGFRSRQEVEEKAARRRGKHDFKLIKYDLPALGDGGFAWDTHGSEAVAFRKGDLSVHVSVVRPRQNKDTKLSKEFAKTIAKALP